MALLFLDDKKIDKDLVESWKLHWIMFDSVRRSEADCCAFPMITGLELHFDDYKKIFTCVGKAEANREVTKKRIALSN
jgi:hypothetical protein